MENNKEKRGKSKKAPEGSLLQRQANTQPKILDLTLSNEEKVITQILFFDYCMYFTDYRIIIHSIKKVKGAIQVTSIPYNKISLWNVGYKKLEDKNPYVQLITDGQTFSYSFSDNSDVLTLHKLLVHYCH